ncbi:MAG: 1,6-anhydro-N-acetylmuramyl-L-alanine amidase AmpD [Moraxella sp.]|nr:1,6-anhydro-N-acetylmuramyl-L-alanine amidase AmpD [Moraxella sp.]
MKTLHIVDGVLQDTTFIASPNFNTRPQAEVSSIIIHNISLPPNQFGQYGKDGRHYVAALFTNTLNVDEHPYFRMIEGVEVSAHFFILRTGEIVQFVNCDERAWHAGKSRYLGRENVNDFSIGIELEGSDNSPFADHQYDSLAQLIHAIYQAYPRTHGHLAGHSDIAPVRKTDPGAYFDWQKIRKMLAKLNQPSNAVD